MSWWIHSRFCVLLICRVLFIPSIVVNSCLINTELEGSVWAPITLVGDTLVNLYCLVSRKMIVLGQGTRKLQGVNGVRIVR